MHIFMSSVNKYYLAVFLAFADGNINHAVQSSVISRCQLKQNHNRIIGNRIVHFGTPEVISTPHFKMGKY